ncbi:putative ATPase/DNA-binding winged helix-turn-helix (wHTH) protein [Tardiphaga robiniae]|uniref:ATP-binding protein n=1 Tax=Tardiphaga robiniae TaxID=943830 RepID=UPI0028625D65|nr:winged helix-turn-helix domain-containing protein [Tardiphaga robiniae]MDR6661318.1 putative ATPase/DNA-binding winged helix-turn-helix (wHTH) protein [Tardiphaga robiniae]
MPEDSHASNLSVSFGPFKLFVGQRLLERDGARINLSGRALEILIVLVERANEVVTKEQLLAQVWPNATVGEGSLRVHIAAVRKALGDGEGDARYLATLSGRGYCFVAPIVTSHAPIAVMPLVRTSEHPATLPTRLARMVGRDDAIRDVSQQLLIDRFVTIVGPGGLGKTTVAVAVVHQLLGSFPSSVIFLDLGPLNEPGLVPTVLASALGLSVRSNDPLPAIINFLRDRRMLLVLDSCEHVIDVAAVLAERIFSEVDEVHILATSRESLRVGGEYVYRLPPLESPSVVPRSAPEALHFAAVRLFVDCMAAGGRRSELSDADVALVCEICNQLDGLALAIELAAGHVSTYGLRETLSLLSDRFAVVQRGRRTALPRHQTLHATLDWSYDLLSPLEQVILRRISVFAGPFELEVIAPILTDDSLGCTDLSRGIAGLVEKSLLSLVAEGASSRVRYRLLETTRSYAKAKLDESGEANDVRCRHAECYRDILQAADAGVAGVSHLDNVRAALEWSFSRFGEKKLGVSLTVASSRLFLELLLLSECHRWCEEAIAALSASERGGVQEMVLQSAFGQSLMFSKGNDDRAREALLRSLELAEGLRDLGTQRRMLGRLALFDHRVGNISSASSFVKRSAAIAEVLGDPESNAEANWSLGFLNYYTGSFLSAEENWSACLPRSLATKSLASLQWADRDTSARARSGLAAIRWLRGFPEQAREIARATVAEEATFKDPSTLCICLLMTGVTFLRLGDDAASEIIDRVIVNARRYSFAPYEAAGIGFSGMLSIARKEYDLGIATLRGAIEMLHVNRQVLHVPILSCSLAEGLAGIGRIEEALTVIDEVIARAENNSESFFMLPEFLRIKGEILAAKQGADRQVSVGYFERAIQESDRQGSLSWQLRASISLARSHKNQDQHDKAQATLLPIYSRFTEGFESVDLKSAKALLDELTFSIPAQSTKGSIAC